jgi:Protein kinase domain
MGVVYRAYDLRLKRTVALKLMAPELALDQRFRERFSREAELAMSLEHPNVVPIHDAGDIDGRLYLAMRHVEGTDLRALLYAEGALDTARALAICSLVANALDAAHANGLVHRDVKPSNVLLDASEHVYLADFGLTRRLDEQGGPAGEGRSVGTPAYLAPEQIEGGPVDGRADVYSLGCLLYECLTGETPFAHGSRLAVAWAHLEEEPPSASSRHPELPEAIDAVIRKAMAKEPEDRYPTCRALIAAAEEALGVRRPSALIRHRLWVIAAIATLLLIAAALAVAVVIRGAGNVGAAVPAVTANTLVRIDPAANAVTAVVDVGPRPSATAVGGGSVWVYNADGPSISEIDAATDVRRHTTKLLAAPGQSDPLGGPVLAADTAGAWLVGDDVRGRSYLTRVFSGPRGKREYRLQDEPRAVAVGYGGVWVIVHGARDSQLLRIDRATGKVTKRTRFPNSSPIDGLAAGLGSVWVVASSTGTLYRINPRSARVTGRNVVEGLTGTLDELREISRGIHPAILSEGGLGPALKILARRAPIPVVLDVRVEDKLSDGVEVAAYYAVSEVVTNTAKHAQAATVNVDVTCADGVLHIVVRDNGIGGADPTRGSGLVGLRDRIEALGGTISVRSPKGDGTAVEVALPLEGDRSGI